MTSGRLQCLCGISNRGDLTPGAEGGTAGVMVTRLPALRRDNAIMGNGGLFLPDELRRDADGAVTGFSFPEVMYNVIVAHATGDSDRAANTFDAYLPLMRYEQQPGPGLAVREHILTMRGAIGCAALRRSGTRLRPDDLADIGFLLARQDWRLAAFGCAP